MAACGWMPPLGVFRSSTRAPVTRAAPVPLHAGVRIAARILITRTSSVIRRMAFVPPGSDSLGFLFGSSRTSPTAEVVVKLNLVAVGVEAEDRHAILPEVHRS